MISEETSVQEIASIFPEAARVFHRAGIDYGCGAAKTLAAACAAAGANADAILRQIEELQDRASSRETNRDWSQETVGALVSHILETHHAYLKEELPRLEMLTDKVYETHGSNHPELLSLRAAFFALKDELELHLHKEEVMLFPYLLAMETARVNRLPHPACPFGTVANPIRVMTKEHDSAGESLLAIRAGTTDFTPPPGTCLGFKLLLYGLRQLEDDLCEHIRLENEVLFVEALRMEQGDGVRI